MILQEQEIIKSTIIGKHSIADLSECNIDLSILEDIETIRSYLREACSQANATIESEHFHKFHPYGISGLMVLSESHLSIHIWAQEKFISLDCYTCGEGTNPQKAIDYLIDKFRPQSINSQYLDRSWSPKL